MPVQPNSKQAHAKPSKVMLENASQLLQLINTYSLWLMALLAVGIIAAAYWFVLGPKFDSIYDKSQTYLPGRQQTLTDLNNLQLKLMALDQEYKGLEQSRQQDIERISSVIPTDPDYASLFVQADVLAKLNGLKLKSIDITKPVDKPVTERRAPAADQAQQAAEQQIEVLPKNIRSLSVNLKFGPGDYIQMKKLLTSLEANLRLYDVQSISFEPLDPKTKLFPGFVVVLKTYYRESTTKATTKTTS